MLKKIDIGASEIEYIETLNSIVDAVNKLHEEAENNARIRADHEHKIEEFQAKDEEIAEWIDILEAVRKSVNVHEKQIDELQMKVEPEKCKTPAKNVQDRMIGCITLDIPESYKNDQYAEQRRWIGKLCWFWSKNLKQCGILTAVFENNKYGGDDPTEEYPFQRDSIGCWQHCEPVKPDDDIIYKGGDNE